MASPASRALLAWVTLGLIAAFGTTRCASGQCGVNSDCGPRRYCDFETQQCRSDCVEDRDCEDGWCDLNGRCQSGERPDAGPVDTGDDVFTPADAGQDVVTPVDMGTPPVDVPVPVDMGTPPVDVPTPIDMGTPPVDVPTPVDTGVDTGPPPVDIPPPIDTGPVDTGPIPGRGAYLDLCMSNADCMSNDCVLLDGRGFCSRSCSSSASCGTGMICNSPPAGMSAHCVFDDIGLPCSPSMPNACARYCLGTPIAAHCTRECISGNDCPAGYACQDAAAGGASVRVCVDVERPCTTADDCPGGTCLVNGSFRGCSASCRTAADCPVRMALSDGVRLIPLPPYTCERASTGTGSVCVPPIDQDIVSSDPLGASCSISSTTPPNCYSGVCYLNDLVSPPLPPACIQRCTPTSGCPAGFSCRPVLDGSVVYLACQAGMGRAPVGASCTRASDCITGLCFGETGASVCTRFCSDGTCPTGLTCRLAFTTADSTRVSLCQR